MQAQHRTSLLLRALWTAMLLVMLTGCSTPEAQEQPPGRDILLVMNCGTDVSLRFNLSGRVHLDTQSFIASRCHINMRDGRVTFSCPGNGLNWTEYMGRQSPRAASRPGNVSESEFAATAERNTPWHKH